jgi:hypothetical protein
MLWSSVISMCCMALLLAACSHPKSYERHKEIAYDVQGQPRTEGYFLNTEFLNALEADLQACYAKKAP